MPGKLNLANLSRGFRISGEVSEVGGEEEESGWKLIVNSEFAEFGPLVRLRTPMIYLPQPCLCTLRPSGSVLLEFSYLWYRKKVI